MSRARKQKRERDVSLSTDTSDDVSTSPSVNFRPSSSVSRTHHHSAAAASSSPPPPRTAAHAPLRRCPPNNSSFQKPRKIGRIRRFGAELIVLNLPADSILEEVEAYFARLGKLKSFEFHYDQHSYFMCTASMEYEQEKDAFAAATQLHNERFYGHALQIVPLSSFES